MEDLSCDEISELMEQMPERAREVFKKALLKLQADQPIKIIKAFIEQFDNENAIDTLIATISAKVIHGIAFLVTEDMKDKDEYTGGMAALLAIKAIRHVADHLELTINTKLNDDKIYN